MKNLRITILLAIVISAPVFCTQVSSGTQSQQRKKISPEKSVPPSLPSEKEKPVKQDESRKPNETEVVASISPISKEEILVRSVAMALSIGTQADVDDPLDKIRIRLESAKLLTTIKPIDSSYIVAQAADMLLERKKKEQSADEQTRTAILERELVALFSKLDPEKTEKFIQDSLDAAAESIKKSTADNSTMAPLMRAQKMAELASVLIDNGNPTGVDLLLKSVSETGRVANGFVRPFRDSVLDPAMKEIMSARIKQAFSGVIVAETEELLILAAPVVGITSRDKSYSTINAAILELELNSLKHLEATLRVAREQDRLASYDNSLDRLCVLFASRLRDVYAKLLPERVKEVDLCLNNIQTLVSFKIGERGERAKAETFQDKLDNASSIADSSKRERRLINLAFDVLNKNVVDEKQTLDQMIDKLLNALNSKDSKVIVEDAKIVTGIKELVKEKNFLQVAREARRISRDDWRAQVIVGAATGLDKIDHDAAGLLYMEALNVLNSSKPGTAVIRTTLHIAERYYEVEPAKGRRILNSAVRFANQTNFSEKGFRFPFDGRLSASIGSVTIILGFEPERIQDALQDFDIGKLAQSDWQMMYETSLNIENKMLRSVFQLKICEAVISDSSNAAQKTR